MRSFLLGAATLLMLSSAGAVAQQTNIEEIHFKKGTESIRIEGNINGEESKRYVLHAGKGQFMNTSLGSKNGALQLVIFAPGQKPGFDMPLYSSERNGDIFEGELPAAGKYLFQVSLLRSAARKGEHADYVLEISISGKPTSTKEFKAKDADIAWPSQSDASGKISCSAGEPDFRYTCEYRVKRNPYGATVWVLKPKSDKAVRVLYYENKKFTSNDDRMKIEQNRQADNWWVGVENSEFYLIPDAVLFGG